ncbi:hypothetical protein J4Q44_G00372200 [Coregonus suidteri]|uniref:Uncharacterized protein n=1 Tax=Coregonus suidteri TaxID=861788 RepID=A0AAN8KPB7_9TELE
MLDEWVLGLSATACDLKPFQVSERKTDHSLCHVGIPNPGQLLYRRQHGGALRMYSVGGGQFKALPSIDVTILEQPQFVWAWTLQGCWPMLTQCFAQLSQVGWMSFGWWTILDTQGKLMSMKNPAVLQFLTHASLCAWHLLPYPIQRHLYILSCPFTL